MKRRESSARRIAKGVSLFGLGLLGGCGLLLDFDYGPTGSTSGGGSSAQGTGGTGEQSVGTSSAQGTGGTVGCGDTMSDPMNCGRCGWDCLGGECSQGECSAVVLVQGVPPDDDFNHLTLDKDSLYWTSKGKIMSVARNALPPAKAKSSVDVGADCLAVDAKNLYWSVFKEGLATAINAAPIATPSLFTALAPMEVQPLGLALGPTLYWSTYNIGGAIRSMTTTGTDLKDLVPASDRVLFLAPQGNDLYWSYRGDATDIHGGVKKLVQGTVTEIARDEYAPSGIAVDATDVYWIRYDGAVRRAPRAGGAPPPMPTDLAPSEGMLFTGEIALDTDVFYWTGLHTVWIMKKDGLDSPHDFGGGSWTRVPALKMEGRVLYWTTGPDAQLMRKVKHAPP